LSGDTKPRSVLSELRKPQLIEPSSAVPAALEEKLLGGGQGSGTAAVLAKSEPVEPARGKRTKVPTVPVTFHLPVELRDRIKLTAQAKQKTMLELALEAFQEYLGRNPVSEQDLRRLLGM